MARKYWQARREWQRNVIIPPEEWEYICQRAVDAGQPISRWLSMMIRNSRKQHLRRNLNRSERNPTISA